MSTRFDAYCRSKTEAAVAASIPGFATAGAAPVPPPGAVAIGNEWSRRLFDGWFYRALPDHERQMPAVSLVFVQSADGNTVAEDPSALGGGETDKHLVYEGLTRVDADGVLAGATTALANDLVFSVWHPEMRRLRADLGHPRHPAQIILTGRGDLPVQSALLYNEPRLRVIVIASTRGAEVLAPRLSERRWIEVIDAGESVDLRRALGELYARGINVISAVGGPRAAASLLHADAVAELYLTTSPQRGGEPGTPPVEGALPAHHVLLEKEGRGPERGVRFQHLRFGGS
jgi:5-amino-6-(5-phosphoribosylamino)uracil reductase